MAANSPNSPLDPFVQARAQARDAIHAARDTQESMRATRHRVQLQGLIMSWRGRRPPNVAVQSERLGLVLEVIRDDVGAPMGNIQLVEDGALRIRAASGLSDAFLSHFRTVPIGKCACGTAYRRAAAVIVDDVESSPLFEPRDRDMLLGSGIQSCQSLALTRSGRTLGVISLHYRGANIPPRRQATFTALAPDIAEAVSLAICR